MTAPAGSPLGRHAGRFRCRASAAPRSWPGGSSRAEAGGGSRRCDRPPRRPPPHWPAPCRRWNRGSRPRRPRAHPGCGSTRQVRVPRHRPPRRRESWCRHQEAAATTQPRRRGCRAPTSRFGSEPGLRPAGRVRSGHDAAAFGAPRTKSGKRPPIRARSRRQRATARAKRRAASSPRPRAEQDRVPRSPQVRAESHGDEEDDAGDLTG